MIKYALICAHKHSFEAWFQNSSAYDSLHAKGEVNCPVCSSSDIEKQLMAPSIPKKSNAKTKLNLDEAIIKRHYAHGMANKLKEYLRQHAHDVGDLFPQEVRKIHFGEARERNIYGEASVEDVKELIEEGIDVIPLPGLGKKTH